MVEWTRRSLSRFTHVAGSRQAAAIAYYVLLSLFPLILFLASVAGLVLRDEELRADFVSALADALPVTRVGRERDRGGPEGRERERRRRSGSSASSPSCGRPAG